MKNLYRVEFKFHLGDWYEIKAETKEEADAIFQKRSAADHPELTALGGNIDCDVEWQELGPVGEV